MALCKFSSGYILETQTILDNVFINEYLPGAPEYCVKVYIYGLFLCTTPMQADNTAEGMARVLGIDEQNVLDAYTYWQEIGLVQILNNSPLEVKYIAPKHNSGSMKKYSTGKYAKFNDELHEIFIAANLTPNVYNEYYTFMETHHLQPDAMIEIAKYAVSLKGSTVGYPYVLAVARNFASLGLKTKEAVISKLEEHNSASRELKSVLKALGSKRNPEPDENNLYIKWTEEMGFTHGVITDVAKTIKSGGIARLDNLLTKYFEFKIFTSKEIAEYNKQRETLFDIAKKVTKTIGVYYQNLEMVVETYIVDWTQKGYDINTLGLIAELCFKGSIRTLEGMNDKVQKFYKLGLVSDNSIRQHIGELIETDAVIAEMLAKAGIDRNVNSWDRDFYRTWTYNWHIPNETILHVAEFAKGQPSPIKFINQTLSSIKDNPGISQEELRNKIQQTKDFAQSSNKALNYEMRSYDKKQLDALFDNLDDIEV